MAPGVSGPSGSRRGGPRCGRPRRGRALQPPGPSRAAPKAFLFAAFAAGWLPLAAAEEEIEVTSTERAVSVMLLGSIGFQMLLFYLVNFPDRDIKKYSWQVISQTISIFCAVLIFQGFNGVVETYIIREGGPFWEVCVDMHQLLFWLTALQVVLAVTSGAMSKHLTSEEPMMEKAELNVKSWSVLFSHVAGFSAINAWGSLQQHFFFDSPGLTLLAIPVGALGLSTMYQGYDVFREHLARMDDGIKDDFEALWDEETEEAEHDIAGMSLSFLTVQSLRFYISGSLPNQEGVEAWTVLTGHSKWESMHLLSFGLVFFALSLVPFFVETRFHETIHHWKYENQEKTKRAIEIINNFFTFGNAWCFFYGVRWAVASANLTDENALLSVVLALLLSFISFALIFVLDKALDNNWLGEDSTNAESAAEKLIAAFGILVGFSWEQSFDTAVAVVASGFADKCPPPLSKLVMSVLLVMIVFPAWRLYILKTERELQANTGGKYVLETAATQHREMFFQKEATEHALDLAHLKLKHHRRHAYGLHQRTVPEGVRHLLVTGGGIVEVEPEAGGRPKIRISHGAAITHNLLS